MAEILIVTDGPNIVAGVLTRCGYDVTVVPAGKTLLSALRTLTPDLILLDLHTSCPSDQQLSRIIRRLKHYSPVLVLSVLANKDYIHVALEAGADDYLIKPIDDQILTSIIRYLIINGPSHERIL
jgi:DNA-binding response OmpR family regulator